MQLFGYHVLEAPAHRVMARLLRLGKMRRVPGLLHVEQLLQMKMGHAVFSPGRYQWRSLVFIALWDDESSLDAFLDAPPYREFAKDGYHVRMRAYRRWGTYRGLDQERRSDAGDGARAN